MFIIWCTGFVLVGVGVGIYTAILLNCYSQITVNKTRQTGRTITAIGVFIAAVAGKILEIY